MDMIMKTYKIDKEKLNHMILRSQMKQSLIAHKLGVSEKTISRWVTGKVMFMKHHNLEALCQCFNCDRDELLMLRDDSLIQTMIKENLLEKLSPHGNFDMVEKIFLNAFKEDIDERTKAEVYLILSNTNWRQDRFDDAEFYLNKAFDIAKRIDDQTLLFEAYYHKGTIASIKGMKDTLDILLKAYDLKTYAKSPYEIAKLCNNISMTYREMKNLDKALEFMKESYRHFELEEKHYNLCICCQGYMVIYNELGDYECAIKYGELGKYFALKSAFDSGEKSVMMYEMVSLTALGLPLSKNHEILLECIMKGECFDGFAIEAVFSYFKMTDDERISKLYEMVEDKLPKITKGLVLQIMDRHEEANEIFREVNIVQRIQ